jgi:hypothetical protein
LGRCVADCQNQSGEAREQSELFHVSGGFFTAINKTDRSDVLSDSMKGPQNSINPPSPALTAREIRFNLRPVESASTPRFYITRSFWRMNVEVWSLFAVFSLVERLTMFLTLQQAIIVSVLQIPIALILSGLLREVYRLPTIGNPFRVYTAAWIIGLGLAAAFLHAYAVHSVAVAFGWISPAINTDFAFALRLKLYWLVYMAWGLGYFGIRAQIEATSQAQKAKKARAEAHRIELQMLRAQLDPHFLFNSLNSVTAEIRTHPDVSIRMMRELCDYLRYSLDHRNQPTGELTSEVNAVSAYLKIQRARFGDRLQTQIDLDDASRQRIVPSFLLQPLVENAVKHGFEAENASWDLRLKAWVEGNALHIEVKNSGHLTSSDSIHSGVGLSTLQRRLELHYPHRHSFQLSEEDGFVCARLTLIGDPCLT